jgi:hypothetical protein
VLGFALVLTSLSLVVLTLLKGDTIAAWVGAPPDLRSRFSYLSMAAAALSMGIGVRVERWGALRLVLTATERMKRDRRPPVLFLRNDADDGLPGRLSPLPRHMWFVDELTTYEEHLGIYVDRLGPLVALRGRGDDPQLGAARDVVANTEWQTWITEQMQNAALILWSVGATDGVMWELQRVHELHAENKTILIVPPLPRPRRAVRWVHFLVRLERLERVTGKDRIHRLHDRLTTGQMSASKSGHDREIATWIEKSTAADLVSLLRDLGRLAAALDDPARSGSDEGAPFALAVAGALGDLPANLGVARLRDRELAVYESRPAQGDRGFAERLGAVLLRLEALGRADVVAIRLHEGSPAQIARKPLPHDELDGPFQVLAWLPDPTVGF